MVFGINIWSAMAERSFFNLAAEFKAKNMKPVTETRSKAHKEAWYNGWNGDSTSSVQHMRRRHARYDG